MACLAFLDRYHAQHARWPTHREIAAELGLRSTTAAVYLTPLQRKGVLRRARRRGHRSWHITPLGRRLLAAAPAGPEEPRPPGTPAPT